MNYYETLYIVHPALDAGRLKDIIMGVEDSLKKMGGDPLAVELWGKRKLAYFIDKQKYGTYVLVQYNGEGKCTNDFAIELEQNPNILAYLTTSIEKEKVIEQEEDLETQIAGKTREAERSEARRGKGKETTIAETENKESDTTKIKKEDEPSDDKSIKSDAAAKEKDADSTENGAETTESEDKENNSTEDESTEETNDLEGDKNVDSPAEEKSDVQIMDEVSSDEIAENEENTTDDEASGEKESETNQEKAEDEPAAVSEEEK